MKMKQFFLAVFLVMNALSFTACTDDDDDFSGPEVSDQDRNFMMQASYGNNAEVDAGKTADSMSANTGVKMFGQMMVQDHTTAQSELADIADAWQVDLPQTPDTAHIRMKQQMMTLTGFTFDTAYMHSQVRDHEMNIALFQDAADHSDNQTLKNYANKYLPKLRMHHMMADSIAMQLHE